MRILKRLTSAGVAAAMVSGFAGCGMVSELESRLDALAMETAAQTAAAGTETEDSPENISAETTEAPAETESPDTTEAQVVYTSIFDSEKTLAELLDPFLFAVSFTVYGETEPPDTTDPLDVWEEIGWYAAYRYMTDKTEAYSDGEIREIQYCLTGGAEYADCPEAFLSDGSVEHSDGVWKFAGFIDYMNLYFGECGNFDYIPRFSGLVGSAEISEQADGELYTWRTHVMFTMTDTVPMYVVGEVRVDDGTAGEREGIYNVGDEVSGIDREIMIEQNDLAFLLSGGLTMKETVLVYYNNDKTYENVTYYCYTQDDGALCMLSSPSVGNPSGYYHGFDFWYDESRGRVICIPTDNRDYTVTDELYGHGISKLLLEYENYYYAAEDEEIIIIEGGFKGEDYEVRRSFEMDKGTFRIFNTTHTSIRHDEEGNQDITQQDTSLEYAESFDIPEELTSMADAFRGETRKVTVVDVNGQLNSGTVTYEIPVGWELVPPDEENTYMDEGITQPYSYPGDDVDYSLYVSFAKG